MKLQVFLFLLFNAVAGAQNNPDNPEYSRLVDAGFTSLQKGDCHSGLEAYRAAFMISRHSALSHLRAACCAQSCDSFALAGQWIQKAAELSWENTDQILADSLKYPEIALLRRPAMKIKVVQQIEKVSQASGFNYALALTLDSLKGQDQYYRHVYDEYRSKYGAESPDFKAFMEEYKRSDSLCLEKTEAIFAQYGYPGKSMVGTRRQDFAWVMLQHAPLEKQERYFPLIDEAAKKGELSLRAWALLVDRIRMYKGQAQVYGSQVVRDEITGGWKFHEIEDESQVNERRKSVGLGPLEEYAERMGVSWKPK